MSFYQIGSRLNQLDTLKTDLRVTQICCQKNSTNCDFVVGFEQVRHTSTRIKVESVMRLIRLESLDHFRSKAKMHSICEEACSRQSIVCLRGNQIDGRSRLLMLTHD